MDGHDRRKEWHFLYGDVGRKLANSKARNRTRKLKVVFVALIVSGCALPVPLSYVNYGRMAYDANQIIQDDVTTTDVVLGLAMNMECKTMNILDDEDVCIGRTKTDEYSHLYVNCNSGVICSGL